MRLLFVCVLIQLNSLIGLSQTEENFPTDSITYNRQIELRHDNDFLIFTDRYYTTGSYIEYRYIPKKIKSKLRKEQITIGLAHLFYTPTNILSHEITDYDRPYVGYLGLSAGSFVVRKKHATDISVAVGVTGPIAFAEGFQNLFHSSGGISTPPWEGQIKNSFHFNAYATYIKEWLLNPEPFSVYAAIQPEIAFGSKDIYIDHSAKFYFGNRNPLQESLAYNQVGATQNELFFSINFTYRYVGHNALLEGHLGGDNSEFLVPPVRELFLYGMEGCYRSRRNDIRLGYQYVSSESPLTKWHIYFTISVARRF